MRVSAIIPAYNAARFLARAIASVQGQSHSVGEIIVVDDGSEDETGDVARSFGADVRYLKQENRGPSAARNAGLAASTGEAIAFLDADDEWLPNAIERLLCPLTTDPRVALSTADMSAIDADGHVQSESWFEDRGSAQMFRDLDGRPVPHALKLLMEQNFVSTSLVLVRRSVIVEVGGFRPDIRFGEDLELWARIAARYPIVCLPEVLGLRRSHDANVTKASEHLLKDLVRVSEIVRGWGAEALRLEGEDPDALVGRAWEALGYWYFSANRIVEARSAFAAGIREHVSARALRYLLLSGLPAAMLAWLRKGRSSFLAKTQL